MKRISLVAAFIVALFLCFSLIVFAQSVIVGTATKDANLRAGPGTTFTIAGTVKAGQTLKIVGKNPAGDWYHLDSGSWIAAFLVKVSATTPTATAPPAGKKATPTPTRTPVARVVTTPTKVDASSDPVAQTYIQGAQGALLAIASGSETIHTRFLEAAGNVSVIFTNEWKLDVGGALAKFKIGSEAIRKLKPPTYLADLQSDLVAMANHVDKSATLFASGIDELDANKLKAGNAELQAAMKFVDSAQAKLALFRSAQTGAAAPTPATASTDATAWYAGGTLHKATLAEWAQATERNKLATAADWVTAGYNLTTVEEMAVYAPQLVDCLDAFIASNTVMSANSPIVDSATVCLIMLKPTK